MKIPSINKFQRLNGLIKKIKQILFSKSQMQKLLTSRTNRDQQLISVGNISPEKYGRSAFCNLQYTPSKLVDNVLFKQVTTMRKVQEQSSKNRQFEAINDCLTDKLRYMQEQKNVIITSLNQQITVYKKIIKEMESKNQQRIKQLQRKFKEQLGRIITGKQEQVKFIQSQKQILEERINQLQSINQSLQKQIDSHERDVSDIKAGHEKMEKEVENLNYKIKEKANQIQQLQDKNRTQVQNLHRKLLDSEMMWKQQLRQANHRKEVQIKTIQNSHHHQIQKFKELLQLESQSHKNQTSQIIHSYEKQLKKMTQVMASQERSLQNLTRDHRQEKSKNMSLAKNYESELGELNNVKLLTSQLQRQNDKLRDLLIESSKELERCRGQFLVLDRENSSLRIKAKSSDEEARTWRESYYMTTKRN